MARRIILAVSLTLVGALASDALYVTVIVPRLPGWSSVPLAWWAVMYSPRFISWLLVGLLPHAWREVPRFALGLGIIAQLYHFGATTLGFPGTAKSLANEAPALFWLAGPLLFCAGWTVLLASIFGARRWLRLGTAAA